MDAAAAVCIMPCSCSVICCIVVWAASLDSLLSVWLLLHWSSYALLMQSMYCAAMCCCLKLATLYFCRVAGCGGEGSIVSSDGGGVAVAYSWMHVQRWSDGGWVTVAGDTET